MAMLELLSHTDICGVPTGASFNFLLLLTTGLLTGFSHCMGMCGPLVSTFVLHQRQARVDLTSALLLYQLGRLTTYSLFGLVAGSFGALVRIGVVGQGWQAGASVGIGIVMLLAGVSLLGWLPLHYQPAPLRLIRKISASMRRLLQRHHPFAHFGLGLSNGLLPCGAVYTMTLLAAATGDPLRGALAMFVFGLGTLPAMIGIGLFASQLGLRLRSHLYRVAAVMILLVGLQLILRGLALGQQVAHRSIAGVMLW